ncbi:hypothetical protein BDV30DRAFT_7509 [Aspergillus minisclerotigenes]|uniref:Uncharacterized protein n=1 Tax=Aspergillus minisclerotigenes TaxID=656917 RepID=A0A5N6JH91_9EURO|nr:hypothetical protein BDV30DRAFT_7509 [Aspergillus minisclerotigenes]
MSLQLLTCNYRDGDTKDVNFRVFPFLNNKTVYSHSRLWSLVKIHAHNWQICCGFH